MYHVHYQQHKHLALEDIAKSLAVLMAVAGKLLATNRISHKLIAHELAVPPMTSSQREALVPLSSLPAQKKAAMHKQRT